MEKKKFHPVVWVVNIGSTIILLSSLFNYNQMKMTYLSRPPTNLNLIGELCDSLGMDFLTSFVGNHSATGGFRVNSTSVKGGIISDPLFACTGLKCKLWQSVPRLLLKVNKVTSEHQTSPKMA